MKLPKLSSLISYAAVAANGVVWLANHVAASPFPLPPWVAPILSGAAVVAGIVLHYTSPPGTVAPTPNLTVDDGGPALGKASGEAGATAGKGPFKP
jgi:hypothetical protein